MKIREVHSIPLMGQTVDSGWGSRLDQEENLHTLIEVKTEDGVTGIGSIYTSQAFVDGSLRLLKPFLIGECALEPERVSEKLHQMTFWNGRGGAVTHTISGIDIALWDILGKVTGQPVARLLGGYYRQRIKPYGSILFDEPQKLRDTLHQTIERGFRAIKLGWGPFGRVSQIMDEALVKTVRETVGSDIDIMVDAGGSAEFWPHRYKWALETARMLKEYDVVWFEEALPPDDIEDFINLREHAPLPISSGEVLNLFLKASTNFLLAGVSSRIEYGVGASWPKIGADAFAGSASIRNGEKKEPWNAGIIDIRFHMPNSSYWLRNLIASVPSIQATQASASFITDR